MCVLSLADHLCLPRTIVKEHIPKRCGNLEEPITNTKVFDNTSTRIYGEKQQQPWKTEYMGIGAGRNPADQLPKVGKKTTKYEEEVSFNLNQPTLYLSRSCAKSPRR